MSAIPSAPPAPSAAKAPPNPEITPSTLRQSVDADGKSLKGQGTANFDVAYGQQFSDPVGNNKVTFLTTGKAYFAELIKAFKGAKEEILIAGWQINWDAMLAPGVRLYDVLVEVAKSHGAPKIYIMPWGNPSQVETYAKATKYVFDDVNLELPKKIFFVGLSATDSDIDDNAKSFFSHHQKEVVIDRKIAFVGGIDIAYGRYDDESYTLQADAEGRDGMNRYSSCIAEVGEMIAPDVDPALLDGMYDKVSGNRDDTRRKIKEGGFQAMKKTPRLSVDPDRQPRMPWQDLQQKIEGPAAANLAMNFILRWNLIGGSDKIKPPALVTSPAPGKNGCSVQVLRSASASLRNDEAKVASLEADGDLKPVYPLYKKNYPSGKQDDISRGWGNLIDNAQHYIYIENQFFSSAFGQPNPKLEDPKTGPGKVVYDANWTDVRATRIMPGNADGPIQNDICRRIGKRLWTAITDAHQKPFHVYIVLPVHPEGLLDNGATVAQIHWTMQSLVFGSESLLNQVYAALDKVGKPRDDWTKYLTLLNLRNWALLGDGHKADYSLVTEQIYVHTKLIIVDDRYCVHGSANINDRSMLGGRDSELAVLIHDSVPLYEDLDGSGNKVLVLKHARELRTAIWRKIFGLEMKSTSPKGGAMPAAELEAHIAKPAAPATVQAIQKVAITNAEAYEAVFDWIPRSKVANSVSGSGYYASIWPRWPHEYPEKKKSKQDGLKGRPMPFDSDFWISPQLGLKAFQASAKYLSAIKGFIVRLPVDWTNGENNNIPWHINLVAENDVEDGINGSNPVRMADAGAPENEGRSG